MPTNEDIYWVALNHVPGIGPVTFRQMLDMFGSAQAVWLMKDQVLKEALVKPTIREALRLAKKTIEPEMLYASITQRSIKIITLAHENYPALLKEIYDPPPVLYMLGEMLPQDEKSLAVVGTRHMTTYGAIATEKLVTELVSYGCTIVSGLARGIDGAAHKAAIKAAGRTIAVLGGGLYNIYPPQHKDLAYQIAAGYGAVISEFPPSLPAVPGNFPARNRIISGLSKGTLVVEAAEKSGTMLTVESALEQNREVFAVPGPITSILSVGTMRLIKDGAKLVTCAADILEELQIGSVPLEHIPKPLPDNSEQVTIVQLLTFEPKHIDDIVRESRLPPKDALAALSLLELSGYISILDQKAWLV